MTSHPNIITFKPEMVRAIREGRKTQTRRTSWKRWEGVPVGHILLVGETWKRHAGDYYFKADEPELMAPPGLWHPGFTLKRDHCRYRLRVTGFRTEKVTDITEADAVAEGVASVEAFRDLWGEINGSISWLENPTVGVLSFEWIGSH